MSRALNKNATTKIIRLTKLITYTAIVNMRSLRNQNHSYYKLSPRGFAMGWTGVHMSVQSTLLLPEVVSEIDANPVSFYSGGRGLGGIKIRRTMIE